MRLYQKDGKPIENESDSKSELWIQLAEQLAHESDAAKIIELATRIIVELDRERGEKTLIR